MTKFEIFTGKDDQYYFHLVAANGEIIGSSEGYTQKHNAINGINSVKEHCEDPNNFEILIGLNEKYYFHLKSANHQIIMQSQGYASKQGAERGIESVMANAPAAEVIDTTA